MHPEGGKAIGKVVNRGALGGFAVIQDYDQFQNGELHFSGHGVFTWSMMEDCYHLQWHDSMGWNGALYKGGFEGDTLRMEHKSEAVESRCTFVFDAEDSYGFTMEICCDGNWVPFMEGRYKRA